MDDLRMPIETIRLGGIYLNGTLAFPNGMHRHGQEIAIKDAPEDKAIEFVKWGKRLMSKEIWLRAATYQELKNCGLVQGVHVTLAGEDYLCRCPRGGPNKRARNEWDSFLNEFGEESGPWSRGEYGFWCQDKAFNTQGWDNRVVRGLNTPRGWGQRPPETVSGRVGFRPILERLGQYLEVENGDIPSSICVYGPDWSKIAGTLISFSDYDLTLKFNTSLLFGDWTGVLQVLDGQTVLIDRSKLKWITKNA